MSFLSREIILFVLKKDETLDYAHPYTFFVCQCHGEPNMLESDYAMGFWWLENWQKLCQGVIDSFREEGMH